MRASLAQVPDLPALTAALVSVFNGKTSRASGMAVVKREPGIFTTTFPTEVVTCRLSDGRRLRLFCKYEAGLFKEAHRHRGGVRYEAEVYRHVLEPLQASTPAFYGAHRDETSGWTWLFLEYLANPLSVNKSTRPEAGMGQAARWSGQFHAVNQVRLAKQPIACLTHYDVEYYLGWAHRTARFVGDRRQRVPWLTRLCARFEKVVEILRAQPATVIHGEYYPHNVLRRARRLCPVDWESAAVGVGEIDLAALTEAWPAEIAQACAQEYVRARWPRGAPAGFEQRLDAARVYLHLRWLGDPDPGIRKRRCWSFQELQAAGERLGLI